SDSPGEVTPRDVVPLSLGPLPHLLSHPDLFPPGRTRPPGLVVTAGSEPAHRGAGGELLVADSVPLRWRGRRLRSWLPSRSCERGSVVAAPPARVRCRCRR